MRALANLALLDRLGDVLDREPLLANQRLAVDDGPTPLFCLPNGEDDAVKVARILLAHGADPAERNGRGETPVDMARRLGLEEAADLMEA